MELRQLRTFQTVARLMNFNRAAEVLNYAQESINVSDLRGEVLRIEPLVLVSNPDHHLSEKSSVSMQNLEGESVLLAKHDCSYKMQFEQMLMEEKLKSVSIMEFNTIEAIKKCVIKGLGLTVMPEIAVREEIAQKQLVILPFSEEFMETAVLMIWHKDKWVSPTLRAFMDISREMIRV